MQVSAGMHDRPRRNKEETQKRINQLAAAIQKRLREMGDDWRAKGETDREFAERAGIGKSYVGRMEGRSKAASRKRDEVASPTIPRLALYLDACGKPLADFFAEIDPSPKKTPNASHRGFHLRLQDLLNRGADAEERIDRFFDDLHKILQAQARAPAAREQRGGRRISRTGQA